MPRREATTRVLQPKAWLRGRIDFDLSWDTTDALHSALFSRPERHILNNWMKLPDLYTDWKVVAGIALVILGASDWYIGLQRTRQYSQLMAAAAHAAGGADYRSFDELEPGTGPAVIEPLTPRQRQLSYATARMDFYHAAFLTGQVLVLVGVLLTMFGFISVIQRDAHIAMRRADGLKPS